MKINAFKEARTIHNQHGPQSVATVANNTSLTKHMIDDLESTVGTPRGVSYLKVAELAKYYGVSADYLLGLTDAPTTEITTRKIMEETGLSAAAIEYLREKKRNAKHYIRALNTFLESANFDNALGYVEDFEENVKLLHSLNKLKTAKREERSHTNDYQPDVAILEQIQKAQEAADLNEYRISKNLGFIVTEIAKNAENK